MGTDNTHLVSIENGLLLPVKVIFLFTKEEISNICVKNGPTTIINFIMLLSVENFKKFISFLKWTNFFAV